MGKTRFHKDIRAGLYRRTVTLDDGGIMELSIPIETWSRKTSLAVNKWIQRTKRGPSGNISETGFRWGNLQVYSPENANMISSNLPYVCCRCGISYHTRSGLYRHNKHCNTGEIIQNKDERNIREIASGPNVSVSNIQINNTIQVRNLGEENPNWLTSSILYQVIGDVERAIPTLMEKKHFNDEFPENKNIRINNLRDVNKFLQVFEGGRWRVRDSKHTFYRVINEIYDVLSDALTEDSDSEDEDDGMSEKVRAARRSQRFIEKVNKIRPMWEEFEGRVRRLDPEIMEDLWKDLKMLLMDRQLAIEQGMS